MSRRGTGTEEAGMLFAGQARQARQACQAGRQGTQC